MKTLILYYSKYGTTQKCAQKLADKIEGGADIVGYKERKKANLNDYDTVIIGAPVYMGMLKKMKAYCEANLDKLLNKKVGLFVCYMDEETPMEDKIGGYFPQQLIDHATAIQGFGGAYDTAKMGKFDKFVFEKVAKETGPSDKVNYSAIDEFAQAMG
jgi:menaquinone-dependent protoporphyrinogen oxidase